MRIFVAGLACGLIAGCLVVAYQLRQADQCARDAKAAILQSAMIKPGAERSVIDGFRSRFQQYSRVRLLGANPGEIIDITFSNEWQHRVRLAPLRVLTVRFYLLEGKLVKKTISFSQPGFVASISDEGLPCTTCTKSALGVAFHSESGNYDIELTPWASEDVRRMAHSFNTSRLFDRKPVLELKDIQPDAAAYLGVHHDELWGSGQRKRQADIP